MVEAMEATLGEKRDALIHITVDVPDEQIVGVDPNVLAMVVKSLRHLRMSVIIDAKSLQDMVDGSGPYLIEVDASIQ